VRREHRIKHLHSRRVYGLIRQETLDFRREHRIKHLHSRRVYGLMRQEKLDFNTVKVYK
jgi:hypothetical protein